MSKYRFKIKEEFIRDGLWDEKYNCPHEWAWEGEMNKYFGMDVPDELSVYCNKKEEVEHDGWLFQNTDYVLKEQQEYFDDLSQHIRQQLNIGDELLSDTQLQVLSRHLYGPDYETVHTISQLITNEMAQIRNEIEYNHQNMSAEKTQELQQKLTQLSNVFKVLNLNEAAKELTQQAEKLSQPNTLTDATSIQQLMNSILASMNSIGILERNYTSSRLQLRVNNMQISLDRLDEAHRALLTETKTLIETLTQTLSSYVQDPTSNTLEALPVYLNELSGAALFLGSSAQQTALLGAAHFAQHRLNQNEAIDAEQINCILNVVAGLDLLVDNLNNKQPVLQSMFDVALSSSQQLQNIAA